MAGSPPDIRNILMGLKKDLHNFVEMEYGLLHELLARDVIDYRQFLQVREEKVSHQCDYLLKLLTENDEDSSKLGHQFLEVLKLDQKHVANYVEFNGLRPNTSFDCWPLDLKLKKRITRNLPQLVELLNPDELCILFWSHRCINFQQKDDLQSATPTSKRNDKLLNMLLKRSIEDYYIFVECLKKSGQSHLVDIFLNDGVVETADFSIAGPMESIGNMEEKIVNEFRDAIRSVAPQIQEGLREWIRNAMCQDCTNSDVSVVDMKTGSIRCFYFCRSPDDLKSLYVAIQNGSLQVSMQSLFTQLLGSSEMVRVVQTHRQENIFEQQRRIDELGNDLDYVSELLNSQVLTAGFADVEESIWLTYDVIEPILLRVAAALFKVNQVSLLLPRPDVTTLVTMGSVCRDWFEVITGRRFIRRRLKLTFRKSTVLPVELLKAAVLLRHSLIDDPRPSRDADVIVLKTLASVCRRWKNAVIESGALSRRRVKRLFHHNPQLLVTLNVPPTYSNDLPREVAGVTMLNNCLYVVYLWYDKIGMFDCEDRFKKVKEIEVATMKDPSDIVGSSVTSRLYINDYDSRVIWRVDSNTGVNDVFIKPGYSNARISLVENRLLITTRDSLSIYDIHSGDRIQNIPLLENMEGDTVYQAVESGRDSFFVSYRPCNRTLKELDSEGRVIRVFDNNEQFNCKHLALDSTGRLLAADLNNCRIILLDEHFKCSRLLLDKKRLNDGRPWRLNYNKSDNRLTVGQMNGQVKIFECYF